jgi:glycosyltransferase involved in cell wall biosynthesis
MSPKISVITVVFNAAKTLDATIDSVVAQTNKNHELIIIDGGSTDGTLEILKNQRAENLFWTSEPDEGIYDAMNKGIKKATGEWIIFLGADDKFYDGQVLENVFSKSKYENVDFIYGNVKSEAYKGLYDGEFDYEKLLKKNISHQSIFYRKNIFDKIGSYNLKYKTHADWDFNLRCFENKELQIKYVDTVIAEFGKGGLSSHYDIPFLRESLLPRKLNFLKANKQSIKPLKNYDEWWRFLRNAGIRNKKDISPSDCDSEGPSIILSMAEWQNKIPENLLRNGIFSKLSMFANYLVNFNKLGD